MKSVIVDLENHAEISEGKVRREFDDILQNLREDLQNSMKENNSLQAEIFMMKNLERRESVGERRLKIEGKVF